MHKKYEKVSTFHNLKLIANAVTMGLYDRSAMAAILDMQISYFFRAIHQRAVLKNNLRGLDELKTGEHFGKSGSWLCKLAHGGHLEYAN